MYNVIWYSMKMEDFKHKTRLVAGGHMTEALATIMYVSLVSRETVRIALLIATLNDLEIKLGNILNAYVQAPVTEKVWTTLHPEFGKDAGKTAVIVRDLYGLKLAGAAVRSHLARSIESLGYQSDKADPDLWFKPEIGPEDGVKYYSYMLCYVDDILCIHHNADSVLEWLHRSFPLKLAFGKDMYIGARLCKTSMSMGKESSQICPRGSKKLHSAFIVQLWR